MIRYDEAQSRLKAAARDFGVEAISLYQAAGRVLTQDAISAINVPSFRNSAMDGIALRAELAQAATPDAPVRLRLGQSVFAGASGHDTAAAEAVKIMTGAKVPDDFDTVVPVEQVVFEGEFAVLSAPVQKGAHIRDIGEDFKAQEVLVECGTMLTPRHLMVLGAAGIATVCVRVRPKVFVISTGEEITPVGQDLASDSAIYNATAPYLIGHFTSLGFEAVDLGIVRDDPVKLHEIMDGIPPNALIITTGAVSMGDKDFVPETLRKLNAEIVFHRVAIKPGKPILLARLANGSTVFSLPGNPVSTAVGVSFFIIPWLIACGLLPPVLAQTLPLATAFKASPKLTQFLKVRVIDQTIDLSEGQESFKIKPFVHADGFAVLPARDAPFEAGEIVDFYSF